MFLGFIVWIVFAAFVSMLGDKSTLGKAGVFMISLVFSPIIGLIVCLVTEKSKEQIAKELAAIRENTALPTKGYTSVEEKIRLLKDAKQLLDEGVISEEQFDEMRIEIACKKETGTFEERCPIDPKEKDEEEVKNMERPKDEDVMKPIIFMVIFLVVLAFYAYYLMSTSSI